MTEQPDVVAVAELALRSFFAESTDSRDWIAAAGRVVLGAYHQQSGELVRLRAELDRISGGWEERVRSRHELETQLADALDLLSHCECGMGGLVGRPRRITSIKTTEAL